MIKPNMKIEELLTVFDELCGKAKAIMAKKNHDYRGGSGDLFANFRGSVLLSVPVITGILLRMQDKMMRVKTFAEKGRLMVDNESVDDALVDIINYVVLIKGLIVEERGANDIERT